MNMVLVQLVKICEDFDDVRMAFWTCIQNTIKEAGNSPPKLIIKLGVGVHGFSVEIDHDVLLYL